MLEEKKKALEKTPEIKSKSPFIYRFNAPKIDKFDKYYIEYEERIVFKDSGEIDKDTGEHLGVEEKKFIEHKTDIAEFINSQLDSVGVSSYMKALSLQGTPIEDFNTQVDSEKIQDFSQMPDTLAEVMTAGDRAKEAFQNMDPELRGNHTTIEGFLNSLTKDTMEGYIKGKIDKLMPKKVEKEGE